MPSHNPAPPETIRGTLAQPVSRLNGLTGSAIQRVIATAQALESGHIDEASRQIAPLLTAHPAHPEILRLQAGVLGHRGNYRAAEAAMRRALALRPNDALYYNTLGSILGTRDDLDGAVAAFRRACQLDPGLAVAWFNLGVMLTHCVRHEEAIDALREAVRIDPSYMAARALLADMLRTQGQIDEANDEYRRILSKVPTMGIAWWGIADIKNKKFSDEDLAGMQQAVKTPGIGNYDRVPLGFALAKALDDRGHHAESLSELMRANDIARQQTPWDAAGFKNDVDKMLEVFSGPVATANEPDLGHEVIFVVSLPRSGSTLVEQILASHSDVQGAGELPDISLTLTAASKQLGVRFPDWAQRASPVDWTWLGHQYMQRTAYWQGRRARFVDKMPSNWMYLGAIRAMLPAARIVVCRRDPLETCFSCYRQYLTGNEYTRTFEDLATFWRGFDRSIRFWAERAPDALYEHSYERLIADPEGGTRALLNFCGLPFEEACLRFYENKREVRSPSATQVRQPIQQNRARSAQYGALLDPLRAALGLAPFVQAEAPTRS